MSDLRSTEPEDDPFLGRSVIYYDNQGIASPAVVTSIRNESDVVELGVFADEYRIVSLVPHFAGSNFDQARSCWMTQDEHNGHEIWSPERAARKED